MSIYESPDAHIALRAMYMSRRPQAGNTSSPSPPFNPSKSHVGKDTQRHPFGEISHTKNLGVGAFMKDVDFRKRPDGTIVALPSQDAGLERVGRTIYGQSTPICHGRPAGRQRWPAEEEPRRAWRSENYDCPTLQQVERRNAQQDAAEKARMTMWAANQEDAKRRKQAIESARAYADAMPWAGPSTAYMLLASKCPSALPALSPSRSTDSGLEEDFSPVVLKAVLAEEIRSADQIFDLYINADACGGCLGDDFTAET